ncbi:DUF6201 family protein [Silvimonas amylolytica]|uniref:DUF6201 family protein n=1 Tax=Silvimonas amylolytica TaxID=449663 RepID=UPI001E354C49|nr:DUF6201 family protein [Silvimonas amylolytica]
MSGFFNILLVGFLVVFFVLPSLWGAYLLLRRLMRGKRAEQKLAILAATVLALTLWSILPALSGVRIPERSVVSPDGKYRVEMFEPLTLTPYVFWQHLFVGNVMYARLYEQSTGRFLGQANWYSFTRSDEDIGPLMWPGDFGRQAFDAGDTERGEHEGLSIPVPASPPWWGLLFHIMPSGRRGGEA